MFWSRYWWPAARQGAQVSTTPANPPQGAQVSTTPVNPPSPAAKTSATPVKPKASPATPIKRWERPPASFREGMGDTIVTLYVGPERVKFVAHKELLCEKSLYFEKMFKGDFIEATTESAELPETDVESFDHLLNWVYTGKLRAYYDDCTRKPPTSSWAWIELWMNT
ncbi:POZ [Glarea lozoyensis ATCC 20868]|uniref:POZ n=1 Tax=Glarea lozoyensis (strain ATCC 20868 / MF5171) TaxID=1116229 RepID=S3CZN1_GLAL2|nr:POZ [Glarea lozoyensis ATCC 20868]EPE31717.1 POZ [Glarea lozoyensis ATCC 20868]